MPIGEISRPAQQGDSHFHDTVILSKVFAELSQRGGGLGRIQAGSLPPSGECGCQLYVGDAGDEEEMARRWVGKGSRPCRADLQHVAFDDGTGIEEEIGHLNAVRG